LIYGGLNGNSGSVGGHIGAPDSLACCASSKQKSGFGDGCFEIRCSMECLCRSSPRNFTHGCCSIPGSLCRNYGHAQTIFDNAIQCLRRRLCRTSRTGCRGRDRHCRTRRRHRRAHCPRRGLLLDTQLSRVVLLRVPQIKRSRCRGTTMSAYPGTKHFQHDGNHEGNRYDLSLNKGDNRDCNRRRKIRRDSVGNSFLIIAVRQPVLDSGGRTRYVFESILCCAQQELYQTTCGCHKPNGRSKSLIGNLQPSDNNTKRPPFNGPLDARL
jgi:hypothetical protein